MGNTPIVGPHTGNKATLLAFARGVGAKRIDQVEQFFDELFNQNIMDAYMIAIQSAVETNNWKSDYWANRLNPGALGLLGGPGGGVDDDLGYTWKNGRDAARAMLVHHVAYTGIQMPQGWDAWIPLDPRYQIARDKWAGSVKTWGDYGNWKWAADPKYYQALVNRENWVLQYKVPDNPDPGVPPLPPAWVDPPVQDKPPKPKIVDMWLHAPNLGYGGVERRYKGTNGHKIIVIHIQEGKSDGSFSWWHTVKASSTVMINRDGTIWRIVPESDGPWTNGDTCSPTGVGSNVINKFGGDPNRYSLTIETEGYQTDANPFGWKAWPKPQAQLDAIEWQVREWMEKYSIDAVYVVRHADINQCSRAKCPGNPLYEYIKGKITGIDVPIHGPEYVKPVVLPEFDGTVDVQINSALFHAEKREVTGMEGVNVRQWATTTAGLTREPLKADEKFNVLGWVGGEEVEGESRWWVTASYSRVWSGGTVEKPTAEDDLQQPDNPELEGQDGPKIIDGVRLYPAGPAEGRPVHVNARGELYEKASKQANKLQDVNPGDVFKAVYWVRGDNDSFWWILDAHDGPRLSADVTDEKPQWQS